MGRDGKDKFSTATGTLKNKVRFCEKAVDLMKPDNVEWKLTEEIEEICKKIYGFIAEQDKNT